eukprot:Opistho-2@25586
MDVVWRRREGEARVERARERRRDDDPPVTSLSVTGDSRSAHLLVGLARTLNSVNFSLNVLDLLGVLLANLLRHALFVLGDLRCLALLVQCDVQLFDLIGETGDLLVHINKTLHENVDLALAGDDLHGATGRDLRRVENKGNGIRPSERANDAHKLGKDLTEGAVKAPDEGVRLGLCREVAHLQRADCLNDVLCLRKLGLNSGVGACAVRWAGIWRHANRHKHVIGALGQPVVQLLRQEWHEGAENADAKVQTRVERRPGRRRSLRIGTTKHGLDSLNVHITQLVQPKVVNGGRCLLEIVSIKAGVALCNGVREAREYPPVNRCLIGGEAEGRRGNVALAKLLESKARCVPQLVAKVTVSNDAVDVEVDVAALGSVRAEGKAEGVCSALGNAVGVVPLLCFDGLDDFLGIKVASLQLLVEILQLDATDDVNGINDIAKRLRHFPAVGIADNGVQKDLLKRHFPGELHAEKHHARNPEEENVVSRLQECSRIEQLELLRLLGPSKDAEGKQRRRKPRVKDVGILVQADQLLRDAKAGDGLLQRLCFRARNDPVLLLRVLRAGLSLDDDKVGGNAVAPPQLARDAPVPDVLQPSVPRLFVHVGNDPQLLGDAHGIDCAARHFVRADIPLRLHERLNNVLCATANGDDHRVVLDIAEEALLLECLEDGNTRVKPLHSLELRAIVVDCAVVVENVDDGEVVAHADLKVIEVVPGGDLHRTSAKRGVHKAVGNDGNGVSRERMADALAVEMRVACVLWVDGDGSVSEHGLNTCRGNDNLLLRAFNLVGKGREGAKLILAVAVARDGHECTPSELLLVNLEVRDGRLECAAPVDEAVGAIDLLCLVKAHKCLLDGAAQLGIHCEACTVPVQRRSQLAELRVDAVAVCLLPLPHLGHEILPSEVMAGFALLARQLLLHNDLGSNTGVIGAGVPQAHVALHTVPAGDAVLDRVGESVSDVESAGDIGRRNGHHEDLLALLLVALPKRLLGILRLEKPALLPPIVPRRLNGKRVVALCHRPAHVLVLSLGRSVDKLGLDFLLLLLVNLRLGIRRAGILGLCSLFGLSRLICRLLLRKLLKLLPLLQLIFRHLLGLSSDRIDKGY